MYTKGKYVVGEVPMVVGSILQAVCFSELMSHSDVRAVFCEAPTSAGFFHVDNELKVHVYGNSVGLQVKANQEQDVRLVARALGLDMENNVS